MNIYFLKNPFISGTICSLVILLLFLIDSKIIKKKKDRKEYIKIFLFVSITVGILIYIMNIHGLFTEGKVLPKIDSVKNSINEVKKTLDTGIADF